jgi:hypothetical protein
MDADCGSGELCYCGGPPQGTLCVAAGNCRVDADCGPGFFCSPSHGSSPGEVGPFYCHTCKDVCVNDSDCHGSDPMYGPFVCNYFPSDGDWGCTWPPWSGP